MKTSSTLKVGDLITLPEVRTVIQLADVEDPRLSAQLIEDFVLTSESDFALATLLENLGEATGQGFFLQGNFGSGKSHLLSVLHLLLRSDDAWPALERQHDRYRVLRRRVGPSAGASAVAAVSLVEHSGASSLEDVVLPALEAALTTPLGVKPAFAAEPLAVEEIRSALETRHRTELERFLSEKRIEAARLFNPAQPDLLEELVRRLELPFRVRRERVQFFEQVARSVGDGGTRRAVLILDELSEFLRSKPDARAFNEDIRFLQFLGEVSGRLPFWIVASLQEQIETTGEIDQTTFGKIKDRYPVRLSLTGRHLKELVSVRLIKKKPGAEAEISRLYRNLRNAFAGLELSESDFIALYPIHPATLSILDDLLPLFSRHRGAVDFVYHQLAGDPRRQIRGILDLDAVSLLGPETILDHFQVRIRETLETAPYITVVLGFYGKELPRLFPDPEDRAVALRLVKILILTAISPIKRRRAVSQLAQMLLHKVTDLDPAANVDYVRGLLEKMRREGAYIACEDGDVFYIDLAADVQLILSRRVDQLLKDPGFTLVRALELILPSLGSPLLPLASLTAAPRSTRRVSWQKTRREGILLFCGGEEDPLLSEASLGEIHQKLLESEADFCVILMTPQKEAPAGESVVAARLSALGPEPYLIWLPEALDADSTELARRAAARVSVREHYRAEASEVGKRVLSALEPLIREDKERVETLIQRAYRQGVFLNPSGEIAATPAELPSLPFDRLLDRVAEIPLDRRYPKHYLVAPTLELPTSEAIEQLVRGFFRASEIDSRDCTEPLRVALEAHLRPLGLVKRTSSGYRLQVDPHESELARAVLERVGAGRVPLDAIYRELRKGPFGLLRPSFELAVLAMIFSGQLTAYSGSRKLGLDALDARAMARVDALGPGEMLSREHQGILGALPFVPPRFRQGTFGFAQQRELWEHIAEWKQATERRAADLEAELGRASSYRSAAHLNPVELLERVKGVRRLLDEIKTSYAPREGLERLARASLAEPDLERRLEQFEALARFFSEEWERYLLIQRYLGDSALEFPAGFEELAAERDRLRAWAARSEAPLSPELQQELFSEFQKFVAQYGETYAREHRLRKSPERVERLVRVREGRGYDLLRRLSEIRAISVPDDRVKIDRLVDAAQARTCHRFSPEMLRSKPVCDCGFRLGEEPEFPSPGEVEEAVERGIRQYLACLSEPEWRDKIGGALFGLQEIGKAALSDRIRQLLASGDADMRQVDALVDAELVAALNDALAGTSVLVQRSLEDLAESLVERSFPKARLLALVERWIDGEAPLGPEDYVKVVSRGSPRAHGGFRDFIERRYPELAERWEREGDSEILRRAAVAFREGAAQGESGLLAQAVVSFASDSPESAAETLDEAERSLSARERESVLAQTSFADEPSVLLDQVFSERAFRFVTRAGAAKLLRMLTSDALASRLAGAWRKTSRSESPGALERRLGHDALAEALEQGVVLRKALSALEELAPEGPDSPSGWEELYMQHLALSEMRWADLQHAVKKLGLEEQLDLTGLSAELKRRATAAAASFERFYLGALAGWTSPGKERPLLLRDLFPEVRSKYQRKLQPSTTRFVLMDGMRWDVWARIKERLLPSLRATYRVVDELALWSLHPTTTQVQLDAVGLKPPELALRAAEPAPSFARTLPGFRALVGPSGEPVERLNLVDDKIHESSSDLFELLSEIELHCRRTLAVLLEETRAGSLVFVFSDHGFRQDPGWKPSARHRRRRYLHGGASPWEVITPLAVLYRS